MSETWAGLPLESYSKEDLIKILMEIIEVKRRQDDKYIRLMHPELFKESA